MFGEDKKSIREEIVDRILEIQQQMEPAMKVVSSVPSNSEGAQGSRKIVKKDGKVYLYHKVDGEWYKTEMEKE